MGFRPRKTLARSLASAGLVIVALTVVSPWVLGWPPAGERGRILSTDLRFTRPSRSAIKLVPASDLPASLVSVPDGPMQGNVWVVAQSGLHVPEMQGVVVRSQPAAWSVEVYLEHVETLVGSTAGTMGSWPSFVDRLPDRSPPAWWPIPVPTREVSAQILLVIVLLVSLAVVAALVRGIRFAASRGFRRLGRPT
jgi:hypothetical protein